MKEKKILLFSIMLFVLALILLVLYGHGKIRSAIGQKVDPVSLTPAVSSSSDLLAAKTLTIAQTITFTAATITPEQAATSTLTYPDSFYITNITGHRQVYALGCEASAAVDWANYFGVPILEYNFQIKLPHSDNPDYGFVGDVNSLWGQIPPFAYGVYADPVADLLVEYGLPARSVKDYSLDQVKQKLSESKPVIVWVIGKMEWSKPVEFIDSQGHSVMVAPYEHVVILTGYDENTIRFMSNGNFYDVPNETFLRSWSVLGNMAIVHD